MITFALNADGPDSRLRRAARAVWWRRAGKSSTVARAQGPVKYFEAGVPSGDAVCSDGNCPCPETPIPRGMGYIYVSPDVVEFRRDALTSREASEKLQRIQEEGEARTGGFLIIDPQGWAVPILVCEQGARLRRLDLEVAAADARHWWKTGLVPLRPTPEAAGG